MSFILEMRTRAHAPFPLPQFAINRCRDALKRHYLHINVCVCTSTQTCQDQVIVVCLCVHDGPDEFSIDTHMQPLQTVSSASLLTAHVSDK